jgi:hypothetical protein
MSLKKRKKEVYLAAFISTVTKYYSSYVAVPFLRKITKILDFFTPQ